MKIIAWTSILIFVPGVPTLFIGDYTIGIFQVTSWGVWGVIDIFNTSIFQLTGLFDNPNASGFFFMIGSISSIGLLILSRKPRYIPIAIMNSVGVITSSSRATYLGVAAGFISLGCITYVKRIHIRLSVIVGVIIIAFGIISIINPIDGIDIIDTFGVTNRSVIWSDASEKILNRPIIGYGTVASNDILDVSAGVHSSYLRLFLSTGIIGGAFHCIFVIYILIRSTENISAEGQYLIFPLVLAVSIKEIFEGNSMFGISMASIMISTLYGYALCSAETEE
jgi:O-antigen ligase